MTGRERPEPRKLGDPSTAEWRAALGLPPLTEDTLSTSARLREVQADLAASQADLTRTLQERDAIGVKLVQALRERDEARGHLQLDRAGLKNLREGRDQATDRALELAKELASVRAELASAQQENEQLRAHLPLPDNQNGGPA